MDIKNLCKGKRADNGKWIEGYFVKYQPSASKDEWIVGIVPEYASALYLVEIIPETVCRYTSLNDKNGNRIFEWDILHINYQSYNDVMIVWNDGAFHFQTIHDCLAHAAGEIIPLVCNQKTVNDRKVIGNIHD